jgi:two-component system, cell cycle sensor histidine kinase and response regulator CckA
MTGATMPDDLDRRPPIDAPEDGERLREQLRHSQAALARALAVNDHLKAEFLQAQKMEVVGRLATGVAHDFKNVLTLIGGYADLLLKQVDPPALREPLVEIRSACQRAIGLAEQLLSYSRKEAAEQSAISLNAVLDDAGKMLRRMLPENVDLTIRQAPGLGLVMANAGQMHQVLLNLVVNARDAMASGGRLVVEVRNEDVAPGTAAAVAGARPGPNVLLTVADTGCGMDDETRRRAIEPFFTTKAGGTGTGLGLSTVHSIVTDWRGRLVLDSAPGAGTTVRIYLPRVETQASDGQQSPSAPAGAASGRRAWRILVVDEDEAVRRLLVDLLAGAGYEVHAAGAASESAVSTAGGAAPDLAVVDLATLERSGNPRLPEVEGRPLKVIGMSSVGWQPGGSSNALGIGTTVAKPIAPRQLLRAVRDMLEAD